MARFTKELREQIVRDFATRHNGVFNPRLFLEEVRRDGAEHPAFDWFEWNKDKAALAFQVEQAREFARDLRVTFAIEEVGRSKPLRVATNEMPMVLSPVDRRHDGGGYFLTDPANPDHMAEHCRQAATALEAWLRRYAAAVEHAGGSIPAIEKQVKALQAASPVAVEAA